MSYYRTLLAVGGYSAELKAVIARATLEGFTLPSTDTLKKIDIYIRTLVSNSIFQKCDYLRISAMNDVNCRNFCRINIANPTGNLAILFGGLLYNINGFKGTKTVGTYLDSGVNLSTTTKYVQDSAARLIVLQSITTNGVAQGFDGGFFSTQNQMTNNNAASQKINNNTANLSAVVDFTGTGLKAVVRTSSTNVNCYNKNVKSVRTATSSARANGNQLEFATNNVYSDTTHSLSLYSSALSDTEVELIRTEFNSYLTSIGLTAHA